MKRLREYYTKQSAIKKISDGLFLLAILSAFYTFVIIQLSTYNLPPGVCPIDTHETEIYISIVLLVIAFVISFFEPKKKKKDL